MKQILFCLLLSLASFQVQAQQALTFEKQLEQAWLDFHQYGQQMVRTDIKTADGSAFSNEQFYAVGAVLQVKDGYIRLIRKSSTEVTLIHAPFLPDHDLLSVFSYAGVEAQVVSTQAEPMMQTEKSE